MGASIQNPSVGGDTDRYIQEAPSGLVNGTNTVFYLTHEPIAGSEDLELNGLGQRTPDDYTIDGNILTFVSAPLAGETIKITYQY